MKLILRKPVPSLGDAGDVVVVKPGYGRNYLLPQGLAYPATEGHLTLLENERIQEESRAKRDRLEARRRASLIESLSFKFLERAGEDGQLFGSVTAADIAERINESEVGFECDRRLIELTEPIKQLGTWPVAVRLQKEVNATIEVTVEPLEI